MPINTATLGIIGALMNGGRVRRGYLGVAGATRPLPRWAQADRTAAGCIEVVEVVVDSPADDAGILVGDLIVELDSKPMTGVSDLLSLLQHEVIDTPVTAVLLRDGKERRVQVTPVELN